MGGQQYAFNAAYGIGKAGVDRMSSKHFYSLNSLTLLN
jgi:hypothetical protein